MYWLVTRYVVVNFNVHHSNEPKKYVFNMVVTEELNFAVMRMLGSQKIGLIELFIPLLRISFD